MKGFKRDPRHDSVTRRVFAHDFSGLFLVCFAGWMNRRKQLIIEYLQEEVRVQREQLDRRLHFSENQRRRLAATGKPIGRKGLACFASIITPDTLLVWHRRLIARKYDSSAQRKIGHPSTKIDIRELNLQMARENRSWGYTRIQGPLPWHAEPKWSRRVMAPHSLAFDQASRYCYYYCNNIIQEQAL